MTADLLLPPLVVFYTFTPSASPDVIRHDCLAYSRAIVEIPCGPGEDPPCHGTTLPAREACYVGDGVAFAAAPSPGTVLYGCIAAEDASGNKSPCVTQEAW